MSKENQEHAKNIVPWYMTEGDYYGAKIAPFQEGESVADFAERALSELRKTICM